MDLKNVVVHCPTEGLAKRVLKKAHRMGYKWRHGASFLDETNWDDYQEETCYWIEKGEFCELDWYKDEGYTIIPAEEFLNEPKITRVEVITDNGREYVNWHEDNNVEVLMQDDGRTMKIFIKRG